MTALVWIRRDLRLEDHAALAAATQGFEQVAVVFVFDRVILDALADRDDRRVTFIHQSLEELATELRASGSDLLVAQGDPVDVIPDLALKLGVNCVLANRDFEPYALSRDAQVRERLQASGVELRTFKDHVVFENTEIQPATGGDYRVFTPYFRAWMAQLRPEDYSPRAVDATRFWRRDSLVSAVPEALEFPTYEDLGFVANDLWLTPGRRGAVERLQRFAANIGEYADARDFPAKADATSGLSVHLRHGTISVRECVRFALSVGDRGANKWLAEIGWRDFYHMILARFPHVTTGCFKPEFDAVEWENDVRHFEAWCEGRTGFPLVDAAMRCLNATGWLHNRLRMVTASFLTKDLLIDWKWGEAYFARHLLDFDLASNNGGWQWAASTGVDAQPHFRIFNPYLQSAKFDPEGEFIRRWVPELTALDTAALHDPASAPQMTLVERGVVLGETYPRPIVEHATQRDRAIALLGSVVKRPVTA